MLREEWLALLVVLVQLQEQEQEQQQQQQQQQHHQPVATEDGEEEAGTRGCAAWCPRPRSQTPPRH